jgi:hypothetical protein
VILLAVFFSSCSNQKKEDQAGNMTDELQTVQSDPAANSPLVKFEWLLGEWSNETKGQMIGEYWTKVNDSLFSANGFGLKGIDTIFKESLQIVVHEGEIYYVPTVEGQNDNQPVLFKVTDIGENSFTSENKAHDFPQMIRYKLESPNSLLAIIEGMLNGEETKREFRFRRATVRLMP